MPKLPDNTSFDLSALVLPVQINQAPIQAIREKHTVDGKRGLAPHLSLVYPFVRDSESYNSLRQRLQVLFKQQQPITVTFASVEKDPERKLLYLKPLPGSGIEKLIADCYAIWQTEVPLPFLHLTLAKAKDLKQLNEIEREFGDAIQNMLPITIELSQAWFCAEKDRKWHVYEQLNFSS